MVRTAARVNGQAAAVETKLTDRSVIAHPKKKAVAVAAPSKATRPLNSWIAFRSELSARTFCALLMTSRLLLHDVY